MPGSPAPIARSDCLPDRAVGQIGRWDSARDPPAPRCWLSAAAQPWRPDFELESSPSTLAAWSRNTQYPSETERIRWGRRIAATPYGRNRLVRDQSRDGVDTTAPVFRVRGSGRI